VNTRIASKLQDNSLSNISVSGTITCNEVLAQSDRNLKQNIKDLNPEGCLETIDDIRPRCYRFKTDPTKLRYGVVAQELKTVIPHLVNRNDTGQLSVNYIELIPVLIASIQQLKHEVRDLKNDFFVMQNKVNASSFSD
jgi:cell division protein FtsB